MPFVVTENCIKCKYTDCVEVCPVDCFHEGPNFLVIDPDECIDCTLCEPECPVEAIFSEDEVPEDQKFLLVERATAHFASRYPVNTIDGIRISFPNGWGLVRASNTQPILVLRFEASDAPSLDAARSEVVGWLAGQGVRT